VSGLVALVASVGVLLATVGAVASPRAVRAFRRGLASLPRPTEGRLETLARSLAYMSPTYVPFDLPVDLRLLTDEQLAEAWRGTRTELTCPAGPEALARVVKDRGRYLDELERRRPSVLRAWLASDAKDPDSLPLEGAASRPLPPALNWDELTGGQATDR
jgi:hypothetical protein